jgi:hypothetical protein
MSRLPDTIQEKPVYVTPLVVDLNSIQRGEGGIAAGCVPGTSFISPCVVGATETYACLVGAVGAS